MNDGPLVLQIGDFKTLPLYFAQMRLLEDMSSLSEAQATFEYLEPKYSPPIHDLDEVSNNPQAAIAAIKGWHRHVGNFGYFVQFRDDTSRELIRALHAHTELLCTICDSRLGVDPTCLWRHFDYLFSFSNVHSKYRNDDKRDELWATYAFKLEELEKGEPSQIDAMRLVERMVRLVELNSPRWSSLPPIQLKPPSSETARTSPFRLFYSFSHKDEELTNQLVSHLSTLKRQGYTENWKFRKITAGSEWEGDIDRNLEAADIILLLVSADFINSDYCHDVELNRAMERHEAKEVRVVPIILRDCDWKPLFGKLMALPQDGKPITSWDNRDEAFASVARGIRSVIEELLN